DLHERVVDADGPDCARDAAGLDRRLDDRIDGRRLADAGPASVRHLYERIVPPAARRQLGEYYTPRGVAELAVAELAVDDHGAETVLDPGCGSGVFLSAAIDEKRESLAGDRAPAAVVDAITETVFGIDLNPVAVRSAKLSYLCSLLPLVDRIDAADYALDLPVFLSDALSLSSDDESRVRGRRPDLTVDHLVGNPPWLTWSDLPESAREAWRETHTADLELFPHDGLASRLGHANDDVSLPFVWVCLDAYLAAGGDASFVLKRDLMCGPAGRLLRTGAVGSRPVRVDHVHDFNDLRPFGADVEADAAVYTLRADEAPDFPVQTTSWTRGETSPRFSSAAAMRETLATEATGLVPVVEDDPSSSWVRTDVERRTLGDGEGGGEGDGEGNREIRHGVKDDARAVFDVDRDDLADLEPDHVYPYLKSKHIVKYGLFGYGLHLVPLSKANEDNEADLRRTCPRTYAYLDAHRDRLESRSSSWLDDGPFYNVFGLGEYTWSDYKVVWCRLGFKPHFAVVSTVDDDDLGEKRVVPSDHCMFVPTGDEYEAHFLCGLLNSAAYQRSLRDLASGGKASLSKATVSKLRLPAYEATSLQDRIADLSMDAHEVVPEHTDASKRAYNRTTIGELESVQAAIDDRVEELIASRN
ncbi:MAG: N-6 DNA methylase, partial [Haloquadratum sp.]